MLVSHRCGPQSLISREPVNRSWSARIISECTSGLLQFRELGLGLLKDGNVRIGVFPKCEEILVRGACFGCVSLHRVGTSQLEMGQCADRFIQNNAAMVENFLKLCCSFAP